MPNPTTPAEAPSPALIAAQEAEDAIKACIVEGKSFLLEAGAGAGKTYSLVNALKGLIAERGSTLLRDGQQIACITFTNVASDTIKARIDKHPAVMCSTIHAFCWSLIKSFQPNMRELIPSLSAWAEILAESGESVGSRKIDYELGYRGADTEALRLHHDDVIALIVELMKKPKFCEYFTARFPVVFIDEYQDTDKNFSEAIKTHFLETGHGPLVGFFGDHWQKIFTDGGGVYHAALTPIKKGANFRSVPAIVKCLNRMRPELTQAEKDPNAVGEVRVFHTNGWTVTREERRHWKGDLLQADAHRALEKVQAALATDGWVFQSKDTKILMLTHSNLAKEQGYDTLGEVFPRTDSYIKKEDAHIAFLVDVVEPMFAAYEAKRYGEMFTVLGTRVPAVLQHSDKQDWAKAFDELARLRLSATVGDVIDHLKTKKRPRLTEKIEKREAELAEYAAKTGVEEDEKMERLKKLRAVPYKEIIALDRFIDDKTPFSTKHGVKGEEFENVLVVVGRGWDNYNFGNLLDWVECGVPKGKDAAYERTRNLFYVACSRPKTRLALLFTQQLSDSAMKTIRRWFDPSSVIHLDQT